MKKMISILLCMFIISEEKRERIPLFDMNYRYKMNKIQKIISIFISVLLCTTYITYPAGYLAPAGFNEVDHDIHYRIYRGLQEETDPMVRMVYNVLKEINHAAAEDEDFGDLFRNDKEKVIFFLNKINADKRFISFVEGFLGYIKDDNEISWIIKTQREYITYYFKDQEMLLPVWKTLSSLRKKATGSQYYEIIDDMTGIIAGYIQKLKDNRKMAKDFLSDAETQLFLETETADVQEYLPIDLVRQFYQTILDTMSVDSRLYFGSCLFLADLYGRYIIYDPVEGRMPMFKKAREIITLMKKSNAYEKTKKSIIRTAEKEIVKREQLYAEIIDPQVRFDRTRTVMRGIDQQGRIIKFIPEGLWDINAKNISNFKILVDLIMRREIPQYKPKKAVVKTIRKKSIKPSVFFVPLHKMSYIAIITLKTYLKKTFGNTIHARLPKHMPLLTVDKSDEAGFLDFKQSWINEIKEIKPNIVCLSMHSHSFESDKHLFSYIKALKKMDVFIVLGGPLISNTKSYGGIFKFFDKEQPDNFILVRGEGEKPLCELVEIIGNTRPGDGLSEEQITQIKQIHSTGIWMKYRDRHIIKDFDIQNICDDYYMPEPRIAYKTGDDFYDYRIRLTGGCPHDCTFCGYNCKIYRQTDIERAVKWFEYVAAHWNKNEPIRISIDDDNLLIWKKYIKQLAEALKEKNLLGTFEFSCMASIDSMLTNNKQGKKVLDKPYIKTVVELGFKKILFGADGATNTHIGIHKNRKPGRGYTVQHIFAVTKYLRKRKVAVFNNVIHANPYSSVKELLKSLMVACASDVFTTKRIFPDGSSGRDPWKYIAPTYIDVYPVSYFGNEMAIFGRPKEESGRQQGYFYDKEVAAHVEYLELAMGISGFFQFPEFLTLLKIVQRYPFLWHEVIHELMHEEDEELKALGNCAHLFFEYYTQHIKRGDIYLNAVEKTVQAIAYYADKKIGYIPVWNAAQKADSLENFLSRVKVDEKKWSIERFFTFDKVISASM